MFISQENPVVKENNFDSNRARAEAERIAASVEENPVNRETFSEIVSPTKLNNPM